MESRGFLWVHPDPQGKIDADELFGGLCDDMDSWDFGKLIRADETSYDMRLNWNLATDTFGETYHFKRLHRNTLAQIFHGDALAYHTFGRNESPLHHYHNTFREALGMEPLKLLGRV